MHSTYKLKRLVATLILLSLSQNTLANCQNDLPATSPDSEFTINDDGTATHNRTGLVWMRCALGQIWDGNTCMGNMNSFSWRNALIAAENETFAGKTDWRLPNRNELESIVERSCANPAINSTVFPGVSGLENEAIFLTSTPLAAFSGFVSTIDFRTGSIDLGTFNFTLKVRLVRDNN